MNGGAPPRRDRGAGEAGIAPTAGAVEPEPAVTPDLHRFYAVLWLRAVRVWNYTQALRLAVAIERNRHMTKVPPRSTTRESVTRGPTGGSWAALAQCESSGNWSETKGSFEGGLQFSNATWLAYGGGQYAQHAYDATPAQQIAVAERVLASQGPAAWPVCSYRAGMR